MARWVVGRLAVSGYIKSVGQLGGRSEKRFDFCGFFHFTPSGAQPSSLNSRPITAVFPKFSANHSHLPTILGQSQPMCPSATPANLSLAEMGCAGSCIFEVTNHVGALESPCSSDEQKDKYGKLSMKSNWGIRMDEVIELQTAQFGEAINESVIELQTAQFGEAINESVIELQTAQFGEAINESVIELQTAQFGEAINESVIELQTAQFGEAINESVIELQTAQFGEAINESVIELQTAQFGEAINESVIELQTAQFGEAINESVIELQTAQFGKAINAY
ncbi:hypothetical protein RRG08_041137 [Elysia crispata]|uniref:Uncharacterized protein n=1 Tax=Elysia crispata TaxID=231223 RepID=A0AAE1CP06_9GAST|nr:hypothetical protein RRG08_041137 [Elysia crispata]